MAKEIELKFLVTDDWQQRAISEGCKFHQLLSIKQGYISTSVNTVRVRKTIIAGGMTTATLTVKGPSTGISRDEFEYAIPAEDADIMLATLCGTNIVEKLRHIVIDKTLQRWEVDVFTGKRTGLVIAEIELENEEQTVLMQSWLGANVSEDITYTNSYISQQL